MIIYHLSCLQHFSSSGAFRPRGSQIHRSSGGAAPESTIPPRDQWSSGKCHKNGGYFFWWILPRTHHDYWNAINPSSSYEIWLILQPKGDPGEMHRICSSDHRGLIWGVLHWKLAARSWSFGASKAILIHGQVSYPKIQDQTTQRSIWKWAIPCYPPMFTGLFSAALPPCSMIMQWILGGFSHGSKLLPQAAAKTHTAPKNGLRTSRGRALKNTPDLLHYCGDLIRNKLAKHDWLVVEPPVWKMMDFVSWAYSSQYMGKYNSMVPNHQPDEFLQPAKSDQ